MPNKPARRKGPTAVVEVTGTMYHAAALGDIEHMRALLEKGCQVSDIDAEGATALHYACTSGKFQAVQFLLDRGASVNAASNTGLTPLMCAAANGHGAIVDELLATDMVDLLSESHSGLTASDLAHAQGHQSVAALLDRRMVPDMLVAKDLFSAVTLPDLVFLKYAITFSGVDPNTVHPDTGLTLLMMACTHSDPHTAGRVVRYLLSRANRIEPNRTDPQHGRTALMLALHNPALVQDMTAIRYLVQCPAVDINVADKAGMTPFLLAVERGYEPFLELLILQTPGRVYEVQLDHKDTQGRTFETIAKNAGRSELVAQIKQLITRGIIGEPKPRRKAEDEDEEED